MAQKVEYIVDVSKTGSGGTEAANELNKANVAAQNVNKTTGATAVSFNQLQQTTKTTTTTLKALSGVAILIGGSQFPQLASGAYVVKAGMDAVRLSGVTLTAGLATTSAGVAGLVAALISAVYWYRAFEAQQQEAASAKALQEQTKRFTEDLRAQLRVLRETGEITEKTLNDLSRNLNGGNLQQIRDFLSDRKAGNADAALARQEQQFQIADQQLEVLGKTLTIEQQREQVWFRTQKQVELVKELLDKGLLTNQEAEDKARQIELNRTKGLIALKGQLTAVQQLERSMLETSAASMASMIVNFRNAQQAAAQLASTLAQMIVQFLILRAMKAAFPTIMGATGGQFPRFMANGGYSEVNGATYFPKFNVVAGEAGREVMTVMARPRLMEIGGLAAQVGDVGPNRMALTNANDLQRFGSGAAGRLHITIEHSEMSRIGIINDAVGVSLDTVTRKMGERGPLSERTRRLINQ